MMGRLVAFSASVDPKSTWANLHPHQRFFNSCFLGAVTVAMIAYALAGVVFGYLPVFLLEGFVTLHGVPAVLAAAGTSAFRWMGQPSGAAALVRGFGRRLPSVSQSLLSAHDHQLVRGRSGDCACGRWHAIP
ncbi:hypothetical protein LP416_08555 [Polaromonas sp. P2-4]|nr:hypothetical protein LP416_08555 [Polaromonas sp. P2-4]